MTRFARARGSKSCNVKQPEEPTSWVQMKKAMESQHSKQDNYSSAKAALDSVKKRKDDSDKPSVWGPLDNDDPSNALGFLRSQLEKRRKNEDLPNLKKNKKNLSKTLVESHNSKKSNKNSVRDLKNHQNGIDKSAVDGIVENNDPSDALGFFKAQLGKKKKSLVSDTKEEKKNAVNKSTDVNLKKGKKEKIKNKISSTSSKVAEVIKTKDLSETLDESKDESSILLNKKKGGKRKFKDEVNSKKEEGEPDTKAKKLEGKNEISASEQKTVNDSFKKIKKRKHEEAATTSEGAVPAQAKKQKFNTKRQGNNSKFRKSKKPENNSVKRFERREKLKNLPPEQRRKKPIPQTSEIFVNGESVKLQMFDGFYVTQEDAERLSKLKADMLAKGLPLKDVNGAIKLERRRAEKALARLKKKVCFHCRKSGHALSECPEIIDSHEKANNVCYKCGSTEHTAYNCKVAHGNQFRFAECFICKEQGHIAKQCPDNPRGLYPKGGACKECGDVTHLKKDCPQLIEKKEEMVVTAGLRDDRMIEDLDEHLVEKKIQEVKPNVKTSKHVRF